MCVRATKERVGCCLSAFVCDTYPLPCPSPSHTHPTLSHQFTITPQRARALEAAAAEAAAAHVAEVGRLKEAHEGQITAVRERLEAEIKGVREERERAVGSLQVWMDGCGWGIGVRFLGGCFVVVAVWSPP